MKKLVILLGAAAVMLGGCYDGLNYGNHRDRDRHDNHRGDHHDGHRDGDHDHYR